MMIFVVQYRPNADADLKVSQESYQTLVEAQRYIESKPNAPMKEPMTEYRYYTRAGEEYRITEVALPWRLRERVATGDCSGCVNEAALREQDCCWYCSRNRLNNRRDLYRQASEKKEVGRE